VKILVIGDAMLDHYQYGTISRRSPEDPSVDVLDAISDDYKLGGCLNVAANLKSLSEDFIDVSSILSKRSNSMLGKKEIGTATSYKLWNNDGMVKTRVINSETNKQIVRIDNKKRFEDWALEEYHYIFKYVDLSYYDAVVVSDYDKGVVNEQTIEKLERFSKPVFIDTKKSDLTIWRNIEQKFIKINHKEFSAAFGTSTQKNLIVTNGAEGCSLWNDGLCSATYSQPEKIENPDIIGCGDVFLAGFVVSYLKTKMVSSAAMYANQVAMHSTLKRHTGGEF